MLRFYPVEVYDGRVCVTDQPELAREQIKNGPVIGYVGENADNLDNWSGIFYLVMDLDAVTSDYLELVWCRYYHIPLTIIRTEQWLIREMKKEDASLFCHIHEETGEEMVFGHQVSGKEQREEYRELEERLRIAAYIQNIYPVRGFGMYVVEKEKHPIGLAGFEMEEIGGESRITLGYYIAAYIQNIYPVRGFGMYVVEKEKHPIGLAGFEMEEIGGESRITLGYYIASQERRKGIAENVCRRLLEYGKKEYNFCDVYLRIHKKNQASIALAQKLGFQLWMPDPVTSDVLLFRILLT